MKVLILHPSSRYDRYLPDIPAAGRMELVFTDREGPEERWLAAGGDAEALVAAPVTPVTEEYILPEASSDSPGKGCTGWMNSLESEDTR